MPSDNSLYKRPTIDELKNQVSHGRLLEISYPRLEFKSSWNHRCGESISAIANHVSQEGGWLVVGIDDKGNVLENGQKWAERTEVTIAQQINAFLSPSDAVKDIFVELFDGKYCIFLDIQNPGDITEWKREAYKLSGTSSTKMKANERIQCSLNFPGEDFSCRSWKGSVDNSLVLDFAKKIAKADPQEFSEDLNTLSSSEVLKRLCLDGKAASGILFGDFPVRIAHYDANDDVIDNVEKKGVYNILTDDFVSQVQIWTRQKGTIITGNTTSVTEEMPYPPKLLREVFANATAHALYQREQGGIIIDIYPDHITVRNNALLEAEFFAKQWFSKKTFVKNKLLMTTLRAAKITDELGTGKLRVFRLALESGKKEPIIEFNKHGNYGKWEITIYNNQQYLYLVELINKFYNTFPTKNHARIAMALILWRNQKWSFIEEKLDEYYKNIALEILEHQYAPVSVIEDDLLVKRWVDIALTGKITQTFSPSEEEKIQKILKSFAFGTNRRGIITTKEAKNLIGLGNTPSESTQLSNLFRKWSKEGIIKHIQRGQWEFSSTGKDFILFNTFITKNFDEKFDFSFFFDNLESKDKSEKK